MAPGLTIDITEKRFPAATTPVFAHFQLSLEPGSVTALLGPSGVGKSTLLRLIAGIDTDYAGTIRIGDTSAQNAPPPGMVFQDARLLPWLNALDNIRLAAPDLPAETAHTALAGVGLADQANAWPRTLSGGMQRRVALARALCTNADLLLLDEPFVSLDPALVADMHRLLAAHMARTGATVLFTTHQAHDAESLATRIITFDGHPAQIVSDVRAEPRPYPAPPAAV
ncbi:MAG: ATP-binding cassette domain-containing protein [Candidatus Devosia phytovorans]|uniref:ATP-binding cassette domain-containing protein n=1 Tax=Candidatus Devosia phytovorans TaxID=3121372 RepID=A0AAJ6B1I1_9HYPH|nr:ATP-binding cassette domain-containing protein [Devosia sp.]WEK05379.1 MAG: ATP-binding cassette domain-containing protein [Devosia sp.]